MQPFRTLRLAVQELGLRPLLRYTGYQLAVKSGWLRLRTPIYQWEDRPLQFWLHSQDYVDIDHYWEFRKNSPFFFGSDDDLKSNLTSILEKEVARAVSLGEEILKGHFQHFGDQPIFRGFPPKWDEYLGVTRNGDLEARDRARHWTRWEFPPEIDPKLIWETSRFGWVYALVRAYRLTDEVRFFEGFWELLESWCQSNPPNVGPQWVSGQEVAIRLLALIIASFGFEAEWAKQPERLARLSAVIAIHADRIPPTLSYAKAQQNNHLLSEACGLLSVGLMFPEFKKAPYWRALGRKTLIEGFLEQIYPDGGYVQHSTNYHRLALQVGIWVKILSEIYSEPFPQDILEGLRSSLRCYAAQIDPVSGRSINLGHNDGSNILPFSICAIDDHRPTLQAAGRAFSGKSHLPSGLWDEYSAWFGILETVYSSEAKVDLGKPGVEPHELKDVVSGETTTFPDAGIHLLRGTQSFGMLRAVRFQHRPAHSDQLQFSLIWKGEPIVQDPGSYRYTLKAPWGNGLAGSFAHNAPSLLGREPMLRAGRFLWLNWSSATLLAHERTQTGDLEYLFGVHDGYRPIGLLQYRTVIRAGDDLWMVVDEFHGTGMHQIRYSWRLIDLPWELKGNRLHLDSSQGPISLVSDLILADHVLVRGGKIISGEPLFPLSETDGWVSPTYNQLSPCLSVIIDMERSLPMRGVSLFCLGSADPAQLQVEWNSPGVSPLPFKRVSWGSDQLVATEINGVR